MEQGEDSGTAKFNLLGNFEALLGAGLLLAALLLFLSGMGLRLTGSQYGGAWVEEVTIYLVVWSVLLATASVVAQNEHVRVDFFLGLVGPGLRNVSEVLAAAAGLAFCATLAWFGWKVVEFSLMLDERGLTILQIPTAWYYAALPASMALCSIRYVFALLTAVRRLARRNG